MMDAARDRHRELTAPFLPSGAQVLELGPDGVRAGGEPGGGAEHAAETTPPYGAPPALQSLSGSYDCISVCGVLEHTADAELLDLLYHLRRLLAADGLLVVTIPAPDQDERDLWSEQRRLEGAPRSSEQYQFFLSRLGLDMLQREGPTSDGRLTVLFRLTGGEGLRPIETLESILVEDQKRNTYKYALLRALANLAMHRYNAVEWLPDGSVAVPVRRIADEWIAFYWPIVEMDADAHPSHPPRIFQGPKTEHKADMGFRTALRELAAYFQGAGGYAAFSRARDAGRLSPEAEQAYRQVLRRLRTAIGQPVQYAGNLRTRGKVFRRKKDNVILPGALWSELSIMGRWVTDSIVLRWAEFTVNLRHQSPDLTRESVLSLLMPDADAARDVATAQEAYRRAAERDHGIESAWTGRRISRFDVDHAIPFSLWGNNDLWNLLPAEPEVNRRKGAAIPTRTLVEARKRGILGNWEILYEGDRDLFLAHARGFVGERWKDFGRRQEDELFATFKDAIEYTARNRVAQRWEG